MIDLGKRIASLLGRRGAFALAATLLLLLPLDLLAATRLTGWEWWAALAALLILNLVPLAGQVIYFSLAVLGAFYLGQDNLAGRTAARPAPTAVAQTAVPAERSIALPQRTPAPVSTGPVDIASLPPDKFKEWKKTVAAPKIQDECLEDVKRRGLAGSQQVEMMAKACACYGAAATNVVTPSDIADNAVRPTPDLNTRLTIEAKRLCSS